MPLEGMTFKLRPQTSKALDMGNGNSMCKGPEVKERLGVFEKLPGD